MQGFFAWCKFCNSKIDKTDFVTFVVIVMALMPAITLNNYFFTRIKYPRHFFHSIKWVFAYNSKY